MLSGKVALVTGAAQGIGLSVVKLLLKNGAKVCVSDISPTLQQTCDELGREFNQDNILCLSCDVTDKAQLRRTFEQTKDKFGSLDIVINNAGILNEEQWEKTINVNLVAMMAGTYLCLEMMTSGGVVINVSSILGILPLIIKNIPAYAVSKAGIVTFTRTIKTKAEARNIRVNCICPHLADTDMGQTGLDMMSHQEREMVLKMGLVKPELIAESMLQLITDETRSGAVMEVTPTQGNRYHTFPENEMPQPEP